MAWRTSPRRSVNPSLNLAARDAPATGQYCRSGSTTLSNGSPAANRRRFAANRSASIRGAVRIGARNVRRHDRIRQVPERAVGRERFGPEHVKDGPAQPPLPQGFGQGDFVGQRAARHVDEPRPSEPRAPDPRSPEMQSARRRRSRGTVSTT